MGVPNRWQDAIAPPRGIQSSVGQGRRPVLPTQHQWSPRRWVHTSPNDLTVHHDVSESFLPLPREQTYHKLKSQTIPQLWPDLSNSQNLNPISCAWIAGRYWLPRLRRHRSRHVRRHVPRAAQNRMQNPKRNHQGL